jgi:glycosyltransferase involved in cell wall biosynthesis
MFRLLWRLADRVVCVSGNYAVATIRLGIPTPMVYRLWNGIDLDRFAATGPADGGPIAAVGRLSPEKGHATLVPRGHPPGARGP